MLDATDEVLATAALDECERRGLTTVLDTGSGRPWTRSLLGRVDHVIAPEAYVLKETGHSGGAGGASSSGATPAAPSSASPRVRGAACSPPGSGLETMRRWEAAPVTGVDSCGAGDTFHGAYAWAVAQGLPPAECFDTAAWSAALKVGRLGNEGIPTLDHLESARRAGGPGKPV